MAEKDIMEKILMSYADVFSDEARGEARGVARGEAKLSRLLEQLFELGRDKEARLAVRDAEARAGLYKEFEFRIEDATDGE